MSEATLGRLVLKRGFRVIIFGLRPRVNKTFLKLGGKMVTRPANRQLVQRIIELGIPPIVRIPSTKRLSEKLLPHYIVIKGLNRN